MSAAIQDIEESQLQALKNDLRTRTLTARDQLRRSYRDDCSERLCQFVDEIGSVNGKIVSGFWPIRSEIDPRPLMELLKERGATLALPVVMDRQTIEFRTYSNDDDLIDAGYGSKGPSQHACVVDPDVMLVPLSVFDMYGGRIGYGAGYYDRAIHRLIDLGACPRTIGIAFALQEVTRVPQNEHDIQLDFILTHEGMITAEASDLSSAENT